LYVIHCPLLVLAAAVIVPSASDRWSLGPLTGAFGALLVVGCMFVARGFAAGTEAQTERVRQKFFRRPVRHHPGAPTQESSPTSVQVPIA
jgi:hypothetical protein